MEQNKKYHVYVKYEDEDVLSYDGIVETDPQQMAKLLKDVKKEFGLADAQAHEVKD